MPFAYSFSSKIFLMAFTALKYAIGAMLQDQFRPDVD
jgi:hypothetical protein